MDGPLPDYRSYLKCDIVQIVQSEYGDLIFKKVTCMSSFC